MKFAVYFVFLIITALFLALYPQYMRENKTVLNMSDEKTPESKNITILATGDIITARSVNTISTRKNNFNWAFENVSEMLSSADITLINLETPLIENCPLTDEGFKFCGDKRHIEGLIKAGVDIANLANNHTTNYGVDGLNKTIEWLNQHQISTVGVQNIVYREVKGTKIAFLGFDATGNFPAISLANPEMVAQHIKEADENADIVVVSFHWGEEYTAEPNQNQKDLAYLAVDSGADLIIGNHPHWIQPGEYYKNKYIKYAHGNFIFDQMWSEETKKGVAGMYTFTNGEISNVEFVPVYIENYGQPKIIK